MHDADGMVQAIELGLAAIAVIACIAAAFAAVKVVVGRLMNSRDRETSARLQATVNTVEMREEEARELALVAETTSDLITICDPSWKIVWVNSAFERVTGYRRTEVAGHKATELGLDRLKSPAQLKSMFEVLRNGEAVADALQLTSKAGRKIDLEGTIQAVRDSGGKVIKYIGTHRDVTQRVSALERLRESELRYQLAVRGSSDGIWDWDIAEQKAYFSPRLRELLGYGPDDQLVEAMETLQNALHPEERKAATAAMRAHLRERTPYDVEHRMRCKDGSYRWFRARGQALWDANGRAIRMAGSVSDIDDLIRSQRQAQEANRLKSEFLANMSHEIRTPLNGVMGMTQLLMRTSLDEKQQKFASTILSASKSLLSLINDILDLSKIEAGMMKIDLAWFEMTEVVERAVAAVEGVARVKRIPIIRKIAPECQGAVRGDADRIVQVLINLLGNALKFTSEGEVELRIEPAEKGQVKFVVADSGAGIAADQLSLIFERFRQVDGSSTRKFGGTGLGLAISREIVTLMRGKIGVESVEGQGATFWFTVPLERRRYAADNTLEWSEGDASPDTFRGRKALVAEDIATNQAVISEALQQLGFTVCIVNNGLQALRRLEAEAFDIVFMDIQMPVMNGDEAIERIRTSGAAYGNIPIVVVTAGAMKGMPEKYLDIGGDAYVPKPVDLKDLQTAAAKVMSGRGERRAA